MDATPAQPGRNQGRPVRVQRRERPQEAIGRLVASVDRFQAGRRWLAVPVAVFKKFGEDRAGNLTRPHRRCH
jgi:hypothetical protein